MFTEQTKKRKEPSLLAKNSNSTYLVVINTHQLNLQNKTGKLKKKKPTSSKIHGYKKGFLLTKQQLTGINRNYANREVPKMTRAHSRVDFKVRMTFTGCKLCSKASITTLCNNSVVLNQKRFKTPKIWVLMSRGTNISLIYTTCGMECGLLMLSC